MRKHKIIDSIFFYDEIEMLYFRLTELDEYVDEFIIMESEMDFKGNPKPLNYLKNIDLFKKWQHKITYLPTPSLTYDEIIPLYDTMTFKKKLNRGESTSINKTDVRFFQMITLFGILLEKPIAFDDLILISDVDEIPDLSKVSYFKPHLKFGVILLRQTNFLWSTKYYDVIPNVGTIGFQYTWLITNPEMVYRAYFNKSTSSNDNFEIIDNGFHLSHFYDLEKTIKKMELLYDEDNLSEMSNRLKYCYNNLISLKTNSDNKNYNLIEYNGELPKNIDLIQNQEIGRDWDNNNLIIFDNENDVNFLDLENSFDNICVITFTTDTKLDYEVRLSNKTIQYNILKPFEVYYEVEDVSTLKEFQKVFSVNETKKIIYDLLPINNDLITFSNNEDIPKSITYPWDEVKTKNVYDLIKSIV